MKLVDVKTGQDVDVPDEQAPGAFRSGAYAVRQGQRVPVTLDDGTLGSVDGSELQSTLDSGASIAPQAEFDAAESEAAKAAREAELQAKYGGAKGVLKASLAAGARGVTLAASDYAATHIGSNTEANREELAGLKEANPIASTIGEVVGSIAPMLLSGGGAAAVEGGLAGARAVEGASALANAARATSTAVRTAGVVPRGVLAAGKLAERGAVALTGSTAETALGRALQAGIKHMASGGAEGALFGVGQQVSEDSLGDHELSAEKLLAAAGHGALMAGALSGGGAVLGSLAKSGASRLAQSMTGVAEEQAFRSLNATKKFALQADKQVKGGIRSVGRTLLDEDLVQVGDKVEDIAPRIAARQEEVGAKIGEIARSSNAAIKAGDILSKVETVVAKERGLAGREHIVASLYTYKTNLAKQLGALAEDGKILPDVEIPVQDLIQQRRAIGKTAYQESKALDPQARVEHLREIYTQLSKVETDAIDMASRRIGGDAGTELRALNKTYQRLSLASDAAENSIAGAEARRVISPSDHGVGLAGAIVGSGMSGGFGGGAILGTLTGAANHYIRERGNATAAAVLDKLASLNAVAKASAKVDAEVASGVKGFFSEKPKLRGTAYRGVQPEEEHPRVRYHDAVARVTNIATSPKVTADHIARRVGPDHAPRTVKALAQTANAATAFLATKIPGTHYDPTSFTPQLERPRVSDSEMSQFVRYADAVDNPMTVVRSLERGRVSREGVEALKAVYPRLYGQVQAQVRDRLVTLKKPLPYQKQVALSILFDAPSNVTQTPSFIQAMQAQLDTAPPPDAPPQGAPPVPVQSNMPQQLMTPAQKIEGM